MKKSLGLTIQSATAKAVRLSRLTRESKIDLAIEKFNKIQFKFKTGIAFLDHMLEHIVWRSGFNIDVNYETTQFNLTHVVWEDIGIVLGTAFKLLLEKNLAEGVEGKGDAVSCLDEALALVCLSFEGRSNYFLDLEGMPGARVILVEDAKGWDIPQFLDGFAQGARCTVHVKGFSGNDPHHSWEAVFRAFGEALGKVFNPNLRRKGTIAGVKGTLE